MPVEVAGSGVQGNSGLHKEMTITYGKVMMTLDLGWGIVTWRVAYLSYIRNEEARHSFWTSLPYLVFMWYSKTSSLTPLDPSPFLPFFILYTFVISYVRTCWKVLTEEHSCVDTFHQRTVSSTMHTALGGRHGVERKGHLHSQPDQQE